MTLPFFSTTMRNALSDDNLPYANGPLRSVGLLGQSQSTGILDVTRPSPACVSYAYAVFPLASASSKPTSILSHSDMALLLGGYEKEVHLVPQAASAIVGSGLCCHH